MTAGPTLEDGARPPSGVSVVIPHFGSPAQAERLVTDLLRDSGRRPLQVIVVDDASPEPFTGSGGVEVIRRETNGGYGSAVNTGAARALHPLLLILNSDVEVDVGSHFVDQLVDVAQPWLPAVVGPRIVDAAGSTAPSARRFPSASQQCIEWLTPLARWRSTTLLRWAVGHDVRTEPGSLRAVDWVIGAAMLMATADFVAVEGFDTGYFMNGEEVDLQRRLRRLDVPTIYAGTVALTHRGGGSSDPTRRRTWLVSSRLRYAATTGGATAVIRLRVLLSLATAVNFACNLVRQCLGRPVNAWAQLRAEMALVRLPVAGEAAP